MYLSPEEQAIGHENFYAAVGSEPSAAICSEGHQGRGRLRPRHGPALLRLRASVSEPVRVGVIGTGDEGSVLLGAINPKYIAVKAIADIRPYNLWRAFHGDYSSERPERPAPA